MLRQTLHLEMTKIKMKITCLIAGDLSGVDFCNLLLNGTRQGLFHTGKVLKTAGKKHIWPSFKFQGQKCLINMRTLGHRDYVEQLYAKLNVIIHGCASVTFETSIPVLLAQMKILPSQIVTHWQMCQPQSAIQASSVPQIHCHDLQPKTMKERLPYISVRLKDMHTSFHLSTAAKENLRHK